MLAAANALDANTALVAGSTLKAPQVTTSSNNASTFKPYNPADITGPTTPALPHIPPPPGHSCVQAIGIFIAAVIRVVSEIVGTALTSIGNPLGPVIAAVGDAVSQGINIATGVQQKFNWGEVATAVASTFLPSGGVVQAAENAAINYGINYVVDKATGVPVHFSWKGLAANVVTAAIGAKLGQVGQVGNAPGAGVSATVGNTPFSWSNVALLAVQIDWGKVAEDTARNIGIAYINKEITHLITGQKQDWNLLDTAADAFGNALGSAYGSGLVKAGQTPPPGQAQQGQAQQLPQSQAQQQVQPGMLSAEKTYAMWHQFDQPQSTPFGLQFGLSYPSDSVSWGSGDPQQSGGAPADISGDLAIVDDNSDNLVQVVPASAGSPTSAALTPAEKIAKLQAALPTALQGIASETNSDKLDSEQQKDLTQISDLLNGKRVQIIFTAVPHANDVDGVAAADTGIKNGIVTIRIDPTKEGVFASDGSVDMQYLEATLVHEGQHGIDDIAHHWDHGPQTTRDVRITERNAYRIEAAFLNSIGRPLYMKDVDGNRLLLNATNADALAERSVKDWVDTARISGPLLLNKYKAINAQNARINKANDAWNQHNPYSPYQKPTDLLIWNLSTIHIPPPWTPPKH